MTVIRVPRSFYHKVIAHLHKEGRVWYETARLEGESIELPPEVLLAPTKSGVKLSVKAH